MADLDIVGIDSKRVGKMSLPEQFDEQVRSDLIKRAFHYYMGAMRQPYGASPRAGLRHSTRISKRRRDYRGSYGLGISRVPRKIHSRRGRRMGWTGTQMPGTVGGRRAHPPRAEKNWAHKLNTNERKKCIRSALAATLDPTYVSKKHKMPENYPVILDGTFEDLARTSEVRKALLSLGLEKELERTAERKIRAGKGKLRGRKYMTKRGPLLVVGGECPLLRSAGNISGVDVVTVDELNVVHLAPGAEAGRLAYFTKQALATMQERGLFLRNPRRLPKAAEKRKGTRLDLNGKTGVGKEGKKPHGPAKKSSLSKEAEMGDPE